MTVVRESRRRWADAYGAGANALFQSQSSQPFDWVGFGVAGLTGAASAGYTFVPTLLVNTGGALGASGLKGDNPNGGMAAAAAGTIIGFPVGSKLIESPVDKMLNPWYRQEWKDLGLGMSVYIPKSMLPSVLGGAASSAIQEATGPKVQQEVEK